MQRCRALTVQSDRFIHNPSSREFAVRRPTVDRLHWCSLACPWRATCFVAWDGLPKITKPSCLGHTSMSGISSLLIAVASLVVAVSVVEAAPMNKCNVKGTVTYQQGPCPSDQVRRDPTIEELNAAQKKRRAAAPSAASASPVEVAPAPPARSSSFHCDGRQYCSQMKSCEEAKYFLANCPGTKMDGDKNGIPCEKQWCSR